MSSIIQNKILRIVRTISLRTKDLHDQELLSTDYLDNGLIDSFQIVELITNIEDEFKIKLSSENLTSEKFRTLKGVVNIIYQLQKEKCK